MKAKCPYCHDGCEKCSAGFLSVSFATGDLYTRECTNPNCEFQNGGRIVEKGTVPKDHLDPCIYCGSRCEWFHVCTLEDDEVKDF